MTTAHAPRGTLALLAHLSTVELRSAVLDGELVPLGEGFAPLDLPVTATDRARTLAATIADSRVIVADRTAAWVWGWCSAPGRLRTCVSIAARIPSTQRRRLGAREAVIDDDEHRLLADVRVTTPLRTLVDLARHGTEPETVDLLAQGLRESGISLAAALAALDRRARLSFVRAARQRLTEAAAKADRLSRC
ncbi:hypothetical protein [Microcella frigidaquae]|uniref:AbiEi antitoxin C-terminal domain-containing protein n=1 Tax=Microcella frigidaquae TaxID=424758 RepID=A0A840X613_9MICO|nr:hypothetical protein [Microcella frigidaquae]MBB5616654.1 hypothetical protein [Microcella frigidaquae]NHN43904.1 hypothetical protein [Microcella frigidaquae]